MREIRALRAEEIECRPSVINEKGLSLLLFKDARVDQRILDETFGPMNWRRCHQEIGGNLYCTVEVWDTEKSQWVAKQDVGTASYSEAEKGQASDSFKRACFNWGIGRELYSAPFIWIPADLAGIERKANGFYTRERFRVTGIGYDGERRIVSLAIAGSKGQTVYSYKEKAASQPSGAVQNGKVTQEQLRALEGELERTGVDLNAVLDRYRLKGVSAMTQEIYKDAMSGLRKTRSKRKAA